MSVVIFFTESIERLRESVPLFFKVVQAKLATQAQPDNADVTFCTCFSFNKKSFFYQRVQ